MNHEKTYKYGLEIRQFTDSESETGIAWIVDIMEDNYCIMESAGVAGVLSAALREAIDELAHEMASNFINERLSA
jgi:hypothetical protein